MLLFLLMILYIIYKQHIFEDIEYMYILIINVIDFYYIRFYNGKKYYYNFNCYYNKFNI